MWIQSLRGRMRANAVSKCVIEMALAIKAMEPSRDWAWIRRHPLRPRHAEAMASRKPVAPFDPGRLAELLFQHFDEVAARADNYRSAQAYRDALIVLLDLYLGLRSANLALLRLGVHMTGVADTFRIDLEAEETKAGKAISSMVPTHLAKHLHVYLKRYRPILRGSKPPTDRLWINRDGDPLSPYAMYGIFQRIGRQSGIELRPHLVRHTLATTLMSVATTNLSLAAAALTGTFEFELASGIWNELQVGAYVFMDADYGRNLGADDAPVSEFAHSLFILSTVLSRPVLERGVVDAGLKALSVDSGMPDVVDAPGVEYARAADEHGRLALREGTNLAVGQKLRLVPGHCDPTVNLYDWFVGFRGERVEAVWPVSARGALL